MPKSILITGASSGIGEYATRLLAQRGWIVWAGYRRDTARSKLMQLHPTNIKPIYLDVTKVQSIQKAYNTIKDSQIPLHVIFNNAGIAFGGPTELLDIRAVKQAFDVNFFGPLRVIQQFLPLLRETHGRIVNTSSLSGLIGIPFLVPTSSSKYALEGMSDSLRRELAGQGISVVVIEPGLIRTSIWRKSLSRSTTMLTGKETQLLPYQRSLDKLVSLFGDGSKLFAPLESLRIPLLLAIESKRPKTRYLAYPYSSAISLAVRLLPDKLIDIVFQLS